MGLPTSRDENLVALAKVKSSLLNNLQDCIVGGKHGSIVKVVGATAMHRKGDSSSPAATDFFLNANGDLAGRTGSILCPVPVFHLGEKLTAVKVYGKDVDVTHKFKIELFERDIVAGTRASKSNNVASSGSGAGQAVSLTGIAANLLTADGKRLELEITIDAGATSDYQIAQVQFTFEST